MKLDVSTRKDYIIATALTGPGIAELDTLKIFITGEIRRVCGVPSECGGPLTRDKPTTIERVRHDVFWLQEEMVTSRHLKLAVCHWSRHARDALVQLGCGSNHWLLRFVDALCLLTMWPRRKAHLDTLLELLDSFTEEGSKIFG